MNRIFALISGCTAALVLVGALLWGVPFYIRAQVADQVAAINAAAPKSQDITALESADLVIVTRLDNLADGQVRIEAKVDLFATSFMSYLERQSE